ncbi:MAG TPA: protein-methionine-sulfoxide reductase heme-binding subunit MsrQ [Vicinamibacterales bacterium]|nr:protein-methionine-sulfoxide reductase heme-binding subunit MsrQ [Vicinamibacterales bacterium]
MRPAKILLFIAALLPAAYLTYGLFYDGLGANPAEALQTQTGIWALRFLVLTLLVTPVRRLTKWNPIIQYRRMLGLFAFFYAFLHLLTYAVLDRYLDFSGVWEDVAKRPFITAGMAAFILMVPLAITSTKGWIRRLGRRWQLLHRLSYLSAIAAAVHYLWKVKIIGGSPVYYALIIGALLAFRIVWPIWTRRPRPVALPPN